MWNDWVSLRSNNTCCEISCFLKTTAKKLRGTNTLLVPQRKSWGRPVSPGPHGCCAYGYRYFLLSSVLQFNWFFFAPKPSALPPLCPPPHRKSCRRPRSSSFEESWEYVLSPFFYHLINSVGKTHFAWYYSRNWIRRKKWIGTRIFRYF